MILHIENPENATRKLLEINELVKLLDIKLTHRNLLHFYTPTTEDQKEKAKKQFHSSVHQKKKKNRGINLPKEAKDLYSPNRKTPWKKPKMTQRDRETCPVLGLEESVLSKWLYYPEQSKDSIQSVSNYQPIAFFTELEQKKNLKICMETQKSLKSQSNLEKLTSDYTTKLQSWKQHSTGTKIETEINGIG